MILQSVILIKGKTKRLNYSPVIFFLKIKSIFAYRSFSIINYG